MSTGERRTVARYLYRAFAAIVLVSLLTGLVAAGAAWQQYRSVTALTERVMPERLANNQVHLVLGDAQRSIRGYQLTGDETLEQVYLEARDAYPAAAANLRRLAPEGDQYVVARQLDLATTWIRLAEEQRKEQLDTERAVYLSKQSRPLFDLFLASNTNMDSTLDRRGRALRSRTRTTELIAFGALLGTTALGILTASLTAVRAGRRINRPLAALLATLSRLRTGDLSARATVTGPADIQAVAETLNMLSEENEQARSAAQARARLRDAAREAGLRVREHLSVDAALDAAVRVVSTEFRADLVVVRLDAIDEQEPRTVCWPADADSAIGRLPVSWLADRYARGEVWRSSDLPEDVPEPSGLPAAERDALLAADAGSVLTVPFGTGPGLDGAITLVRRAGGVPWQPAEAEAAEWVAADIARGVQQARLYEQERLLVDELRELDRTKSDFLSTVSHELRTPLTSISGFIELLGDPASGTLSAEQRQMMEVIERNTNRLRTLIENLLTLSRIEAGTFRSVRQPTDVTDIVARAVRTVRSIGGIEVTLDVECPPGPLIAAVDSHQIDRVLTNLLSNAVKFTPPGGRVTVYAGEDGPDLVLSVSDTGIGIPDDEQCELFQRFFRASNAVEASIQGTGLGLTIVRKIVSNHDGDVVLRSRTGEGTTVTVRLPRETQDRHNLPEVVASEGA